MKQTPKGKKRGILEYPFWAMARKLVLPLSEIGNHHRVLSRRVL